MLKKVKHMLANTASFTRPPGPRSWVFGFDLLSQSKADYLGHVEELKQCFGDVVMSQVVHEKIFDIHHPDLIRQLLVDNADALIRWERGIEVFSNIHGQSVLVTEGEKWKRQRRMLQPGFSTKRMGGYCALMAVAMQDALNALEPSEVVNLDFNHWVHQLTMDVIFQTLFSCTDAARRDQAIAAVATLSQVGKLEMFSPMSAPDWMPHKAEKRRAKKVLDDLIRSHIQHRHSHSLVGNAQANDVLAMLLAVRDDQGDSSGLSDDEVRDQCMTIFLAGHETTALALSWWAALMAQHPQAALLAQTEVDSVLAGQLIEYADVANMRYLSWSLKEALRLYPPASALISRRTVREVKLGDWCIPKGAMVRVTPWVVHRDARWFADPTRFLPERFDEDTPLPNRNSFMPFGTGPRVCIGSHFALTEMVLIAAHLLQNFTFRSANLPKPKFEVLLSPEGGMPLQLVRRKRQPSLA
jgi:cytochrome P450